MKKIIGVCLMIFCLLLIGLVSITFANPFLAIDPMTAEVTDFQIDLAGQLVDVAMADVVETPTAWLLLDLSGLVSGPYNQVTVKANYGLWGWSNDSVPFDFTKPVISAPAGTRLGVE